MTQQAHLQETLMALVLENDTQAYNDLATLQAQATSTHEAIITPVTEITPTPTPNIAATIFVIELTLNAPNIVQTQSNEFDETINQILAIPLVQFCIGISSILGLLATILSVVHSNRK